MLWIAPHLRARPDTEALVAWRTEELRKPGAEGEAHEGTVGAPRGRAIAAGA